MFRFCLPKKYPRSREGRGKKRRTMIDDVDGIDDDDDDDDECSCRHDFKCLQ